MCPMRRENSIADTVHFWCKMTSSCVGRTRTCKPTVGFGHTVSRRTLGFGTPQPRVPPSTCWIYLTVGSYSTDLLQFSQLQPQPGEPRGGGPFCAGQLGRQQRVLHPASARARRRLSGTQTPSSGFRDGCFVSPLTCVPLQGSRSPTPTPL